MITCSVLLLALLPQLQQLLIGVSVSVSSVSVRKEGRNPNPLVGVGGVETGPHQNYLSEWKIKISFQKGQDN